MYGYDVFLEPSAISHSLACNFIDPESKHLLVSKATMLEVYEVLQLKNPETGKSSYKLKLVILYKLQGLVSDLRAIRTMKNPNLDCVLVSSKSAKVSCIRWNHFKHAISTVSLHYYEHIFQGSTYGHIYESSLVVSPANNSIFCLRRNNTLVLLPFSRADEDMDGDDEPRAKAIENAENEKKEDDRERGQLPLFGSSSVLDIASIDSSVGEIIDLGVEFEIIKKSGSWFSYGDTKLGQGRDAVKNLLLDNPELFEELDGKIREALTTVKA